MNDLQIFLSKLENNSELKIFFNKLYGDIVYPEIFSVSIDKVSIMGDWIYWKGKSSGKKHPFQVLIDKYYQINIHKGHGTSEVEGFILDDIWFKIYDKRKNKNVRDFKMEFNPKRLSNKQEEFLMEKILPLLKNVGYTRIDLAFDVEENLSEYIVFDTKNPKRSCKYFGKSGSLETHYIGSKESLWHFCMYDKKKEKMKELNKEERNDEYIADLTTWEREQLLKRKNWWRIEVRLRGELANVKITDSELFQSLRIVKPSYSLTNKIQDKALIYFLTNFPEYIEQMEYRTKVRTKNMLLNTADFDLASLLRYSFGEYRQELEIKLKEYLTVSNMQIDDVKEIYIMEQKQSDEFDEDLHEDNFIFSDNFKLRSYSLK